MSICDDYKNNGMAWQRKAHEEDDRHHHHHHLETARQIMMMMIFLYLFSFLSGLCSTSTIFSISVFSAFRLSQLL